MRAAVTERVGAMSVLDGSAISASSETTGAGGNITVNAASLLMTNGSFIASNTLGSGSSGNVQVTVAGWPEKSWAGAFTLVTSRSGGGLSVTLKPGLIVSELPSSSWTLVAENVPVSVALPGVFGEIARRWVNSGAEAQHVGRRAVDRRRLEKPRDLAGAHDTLTRRTGTPSVAVITRSLAIARIAVPSLV